jgi:hypothetical protein
MTDTRKELADMIGSMSKEQFTQFFIKALQDPETRAAVVDILEKAGLLEIEKEARAGGKQQ